MAVCAERRCSSMGGGVMRMRCGGGEWEVRVGWVRMRERLVV